jgi:hypothetical protein
MLKQDIVQLAGSGPAGEPLVNDGVELYRRVFEEPVLDKMMKAAEGADAGIDRCRGLVSRSCIVGDGRC